MAMGRGAPPLHPSAGTPPKKMQGAGGSYDVRQGQHRQTMHIDDRCTLRATRTKARAVTQTKVNTDRPDRTDLSIHSCVRELYKIFLLLLVGTVTTAGG